MKKQSTSKTSLDIAKLLLDNFYSKEEVVSKLNIKTSTFFKDIHLMNKAGIKFEKENKKYKIVKFKNVLNLNSQNTGILAHVLAISGSVFPKNKLEGLFLIFKRFLYLSNEENYIDFLKKYKFFKSMTADNEEEKKIELFQKYINKDKALRVIIKGEKENILKPIEFIWGEKNTYFVFEDVLNNEKKEILPEDIIKMYPIQEALFVGESRETIFELYGRLARNYVLKNEEIILEAGLDKIVIANYSSDKNKLFKRLLRYDVLCRIKSPKQDKEAFENILKKSLDNIEKFQDNSIK